MTYKIKSQGRKRPLRAGDGELKVFYGSVDGEPADLSIVWGDGVGKRRSNLMFSLLGPLLKFPPESGMHGAALSQQDFAKELDAAGFDLSTLKITIKMRADAMQPPKEPSP